MRRAAKIDTTQNEIVKAFREMGASVGILSAVGKGMTDLVIGYRGLNVLIECKTGNKGLTPDQEKFHANWKGDVRICRNTDDAIGIIDSLNWG